MELFYSIIFVFYVICAIGLFIYGVNCYLLVLLFLRTHRGERRRWHKVMLRGRKLFDDEAALPHVTTQIPLYNEANVSERILRSVASLDYPRAKHEIQVLDDSSDETRDLVDAVAAELKSRGHDITVFRRDKRVGYKAGALREGMAVCKGEYLAIFDADFVPPTDYLKKMVPALASDQGLGFVQARWGHLNSSYSLLTRSQSLGIDGHFMIEQCARAYNRLFLNFNGTAGLWRKQAILDAGNWQDDTLTEDMDLSYRCQLAGWRATYVPDVIVPAELPETYAAFKSQQFRWAKGSIQTALKIFPAVLRSDFRLLAKVQAFLHLTHYAIHPMMALMALLALPVLLTLKSSAPPLLHGLMALGIVAAMFGPSTMYWVSQVVQSGERMRRLFFLPALMCVGVGIALSNTRAVLEAVLGVRSGFVRTPKSGSRKVVKYRAGVGLLPALEIALGCYCAYSLFVYLAAGKYLVGPFLLVYTLGFLFVGLSSFRELLARS